MDFKIIEHIGVVAERKGGYKREVNLISWHDSTPKIDIRDWDAEHERCSKGIVLTEQDAKTVAEILTKYYGGTK